ncbi:hypothetical protein BJ508DRAFT_156387 [Ascobolus immersus RN42]|uniref:F-box domain-containing protein n=1 Tax=Ascobolus immersus RN42 TaxID=1160509 RepID=A0A3N4HZ54_ASCIM|nr:hypothetical protein BJ508DRAFT_156387 [Ascobolus immersus RN42]
MSEAIRNTQPTSRRVRPSRYTPSVFRLLDLPRELRLQIYTKCDTTSLLQLSCTSRTLKNEIAAQIVIYPSAFPHFKALRHKTIQAFMRKLIAVSKKHGSFEVYRRKSAMGVVVLILERAGGEFVFGAMNRLPNEGVKCRWCYEVMPPKDLWRWSTRLQVYEWTGYVKCEQCFRAAGFKL